MANLSSLIGGNGWEHFGEITKRKAANASGQDVAGDTLTTVELDTEHLDTGNKVSLSANVITLEAGTYEFNLDLRGYESNGTGSAHFRLWNITDSSILNSCEISNSTPSGSGHYDMKGVFQLSSQKDIRIEVLSESGGHFDYSASTITQTDEFDSVKFQFKWKS